MSSFTLRQLELFSALPEYRTLSAAASALHISESALSHAVSELERAVVEQLCVRHKAKGLQLTPAGQFVATRARILVTDANELVSQLAAEWGVMSGPMTIGCYTGFASTMMPPVLDGFARAHPKVKIGVNIGTDDELWPALLAGLLDVAIVYDMYVPDGMNRRPVYETEVLAVLPEDHPLAGQPAIDLADLAPEPLIMLDTAPSAGNTRRVFDERGLEPNLHLQVPNLELVRVLVARGLGYRLLMRLPYYSVTTLEGRRVVMKPLNPQAGRTSVVAVWPDQMDLSRRADALVNHLAAGLGNRNAARSKPARQKVHR
ncbi:LysR family transcriptional regulator [Rhodococcus sp. NPDC059968]|uniref:LysR family transcriptional regulator n=1 Tax=Rhodococcus sp. NPDC059968 TaxID=3347017 RepID=UPI0036731FCA